MNEYTFDGKHLFVPKESNLVDEILHRPNKVEGYLIDVVAILGVMKDINDGAREVRSMMYRVMVTEGDANGKG